MRIYIYIYIQLLIYDTNMKYPIPSCPNLPLSDPGTAGTVGIAGLGIAGAAARCQRAVAGSTKGTGPEKLSQWMI